MNNEKSLIHSDKESTKKTSWMGGVFVAKYIGKWAEALGRVY